MMKTVALACLGLVSASNLRAAAPATTMANASGPELACGKDEWNRYNEIVCLSAPATSCDTAGTTGGTLEWCDKWVHDWKLKFGACNLIGCDIVADEFFAEPASGDADGGDMSEAERMRAQMGGPSGAPDESADNLSEGGTANL